MGDSIQPVQAHWPTSFEMTTTKLQPRGLETAAPSNITSPNEQDGNLANVDSPLSTRRSKFQIVAIMTACFATIFTTALNQTIVATALPTICASLSAAWGYSWIGGAYLLALTAFAPIWAKLSDIWGRKPILLAAVGGFLVASIVCATAKDMTGLVLGRAIQGAAGGGLAQMVYIIFADLFSLRGRGLVIGASEGVWAVAGGIGPVLGGAITQGGEWRWVFWVNVPIAGIAFILLLVFLDVHDPRTKVVEGLKAVDWFGSLSILGLLVMLLLGLNFGGATFPWNSPTVICLIVFGAAMCGFFIFNERKLAKYPLMPLALFANRSNIAALITAFVHAFVYIAPEYYLPLYLQSVYEASPLRSGILIIPSLVTEAAIGIITGIVMHRTGKYLELIWLGVTLHTIGTGLYIHLNAASSLAEIVSFQIIAGIGVGLLFSPPVVALQAHVSQADTATATATLGLMRSLATCLSVIIGGVVFQNGMQTQAAKLHGAGLLGSVAESLSGSDAAANVVLLSTIEDASQKLAVKEAFAWSLRNLWILCTCLSACGIIASWFLVKKELSEEHTETKTGIKREGTEV